MVRSYKSASSRDANLQEKYSQILRGNSLFKNEVNKNYLEPEVSLRVKYTNEEIPSTCQLVGIERAVRMLNLTEEQIKSSLGKDYDFIKKMENL